MNKKLLSLLFLATLFFTLAQEKGLDQQIDEAFGNATGWFVDIVFYQIPFSDSVSIYWVLLPLILGALYCTFYFNFSGFFISINIVAGFLGMASKFVECTLGVKYRDIEADGTVFGGSMYYLTKGLKNKT